jgi:preprotein translocase subunit SecD
VTGRRGVSFALENTASAAFQAFATAHPGEFVAVVLDGVVMAVLPITGQAAKARFSFTGDYTEAESRLLAGILNKDPLRFPLEKLRDVEVAAP